MDDCQFCNLAGDRIVDRNSLAVAIRDEYPVSPGHTLIVPRRHVTDWFEATAAERIAIFELIDACKAALDAERSPKGYNIGMNCGKAAGQTVEHLHVHLIPRYDGDVDDPDGGVRFVIPEAGNYRRPGHIPRSSDVCRPDCLATGGYADPFLKHLEPLLARASRISILAAFVQESGVAVLDPWLVSAMERNCEVRILTGDYLNLTQAQALRRLADLEHAENLTADTADEDERGAASVRGPLSLRVVEIEALKNFATTFHPKAWIFESDEPHGTAFVGSNNVSRAALKDGLEWSLRLDERIDAGAFMRIVEAFDGLWQRGRTIDQAWLDAYAARARAAKAPLPPGELLPEVIEVPVPRDVQIEALAALDDARAAGCERAITVMATGLGKTWLAAFDVQQLCERREAMPKVLFLAHRIEILRQAARTFRSLFPDAVFSWFVGTDSNLNGDVVFASIAKLSRSENLAAVDPQAFDYIVVDEVHHAAAATYRRIMEYLQPEFWLGLTATPERADAGDVLGLFDDHVVYRAEIGVGIALGHLVPFAYYGLADTVDYRPIPWRNRRFDPQHLEEEVMASDRMETLWRALGEHPGERTLVFCCSIRHAIFASDFLNEHELKTVAVHSGPGSADRQESVYRLEAGELQAICTVDLFNEGVDIPLVDRVVMLRPTESTVVFLQQLGRGLRIADGKEQLTVIDFIGNHRVFLNRIRTVLSLLPGDSAPSVAALINAQTARADNCSVAIELEAVDLLRALLPAADQHVLTRAYRELRAGRDERPSLAEMFRLGYNPASLYRTGALKCWFAFIENEGDLAADEQQALHHLHDWFEALERREAMTKSFKMVVLEVLLASDSLFTGMDLETLAQKCYRCILRSPELFEDILAVQDFDDPRTVPPDQWLRYWRGNPIEHWAPWFEVKDGRFAFVRDVPTEMRAAAAAMMQEVVTFRLAKYRRRREVRTVGVESFACRVIQSNGQPIIKLPDRTRHPGVPQGETNCTLPNGMVWRFRFVKFFINVARPVGEQHNQLAELMREWFGPDAGQPGTDFQVEFSKSGGFWQVAPELIEEPARLKILSRSEAEILDFEDLLAVLPAIAAGPPSAELSGRIDSDEWIRVPSRQARPKRFVVMVDGDSMEPTMSRRDYVVCEYHRTPREVGQVVIMADFSAIDAGEVAIKRYEDTPEEWVFNSDNTSYLPRKVLKINVPSHPILGIVVYNLTQNCPVR